MFGSVVLDVAIGMTFVYLLLSLIATVLQEMLAAALQLRPANLLRGIRSLFSGDSLWGIDLVSALYDHGLVRGLYSDPNEDRKLLNSTRHKAPAWLPARFTAEARTWPKVIAATADVPVPRIVFKREVDTAGGSLSLRYKSEWRSYGIRSGSLLGSAVQQLNLQFDAAGVAVSARQVDTTIFLVEKADEGEVEPAASKIPSKAPSKAAIKAPSTAEDLIEVRVGSLTDTPPPGRFRRLLFHLFQMQHEEGVTSVTDASLLPAYIPSRTFALAMIDLLNREKKSGAEVMTSISDSLAAHHWMYRDNKAGQALFAMAIDAKGDVDAFQQNLEDWYNDAMDRVSGWYKRHIQRVLLYLGLILAISFNVDTVRVARTLWFDRDARQTMVSAADSYVKNHSATAPPEAPAQGAPATVAAAAADAGKPDAKPAEVDSAKLKEHLQKTVGAFNDVTQSALLPVGWKTSEVSTLKRGVNYMKVVSYHAAWWSGLFERLTLPRLWLFLQVLFGWLVTGLAISLGAPFWFDTLNKFMVVRSTIKPSEKSPNEPSKD